MDTLLTAFFFIVIVGFIVFIHELGHFLAAKYFKIDVKQFAIGFGPKLFERYYKGTKYQVRLLPLGGFVDIEGENDSSVAHGFRSQKLLPKVIVLSAGVFMNLVAGLIFLSISLFIQNFQVTLPDFTNYNFLNTDVEFSAYPIVLTSIKEDSPAQGILSEKEIVVGINNTRFRDSEDFLKLLKDNQNSTVEFELIDPDTFELYYRSVALPAEREDGTILRAGFTTDGQLGGVDKPSYFIKYKRNIASPIAFFVDISFYQVKSIARIFADAFESSDYSEAGEVVGGPVALGDSINQIVEFRVFEALIFLTAMINLSLVFVNVLPIPALDGGQILIAVIESIKKERLSDRTLGIVNTAGFLFLISLMLIMGVKDISQFNIVGGVKETIEKSLGK